MAYDGSIKIDTKLDSKGILSGLQGIGTAIAGAAAAGAAALAGLAVAGAKVGIEWESAFAGVKKTVDGTDEQLATLSDGIRNMAKEIPLAATEIAGIAEAAGQLGIETDNVLAFTRVMADLGVATNMTAEEAATALARVANITGMAQGDFDRLGSTIVALGNNFATTESEIVAMTLRLAGAGSQIGLTEAQIMGFASALSSVGIEAEAGGSAFSKVMIDMQLAAETGSDKLKEFANVAGMSADAFASAFREDAAGALVSFISGLANMEARGQSAIKTLDDMGIKEVRLRDALLRAANSSEIFSNAIGLATDAWSENVALSNEAAQRYETLESQLVLMGNAAKDLGITFKESVDGDIRGAVDAATKALGRLSKEISSPAAQRALATLSKAFEGLVRSVSDAAAKAIPAFLKAVAGIVEHGNKLVAVLSGVVAGMAAFRAASAASAAIDFAGSIARSVAAMGAFSTATDLAFLKQAALGGAMTVNEIITALLTGKITLATAAQIAWNAAMAANPAGMIAVAVGALVAGIGLLIAATQDANKELEEQRERARDIAEAYQETRDAAAESARAFGDSRAAISENAEHISSLVDKAYGLARHTDLAADAERELQAALAEINALMPGLNLAYDQQAKAINLTEKATRDLISAKMLEADTAAAERRISDLADERISMIEKRTVAERELASAQEKARELEAAYAEEVRRDNESVFNRTRYIGEAYKALQAQNEIVLELQGTVSGYTQAIGENTAASTEYAKQVVQGNEALRQSSEDATAAAIANGDAHSLMLQRIAEEYDVVGEAAEEFLSELAADWDMSAEQMQAALEHTGLSITEFGNSLNELAAQGQAFKEHFEDVWSSIEAAATSAFSRINDESATLTFAELNENLEHNQRIVSEWAENLDKLAEAGLEDGLIEQLRSAGPDSYAQVAALAGELARGTPAVKTALDELNATWKKGMDLIPEATSKVFESTDFSASAKAYADNIQSALDGAIKIDDFLKHGESITSGTAKGIADDTDKVVGAVEAMAKDSSDRFSEYNKSNSPSKLYEQHGRDMALGAVQGIEGGTPLVAESARKLAAEADTAARMQIAASDFVSIGRSIAEGMAQGINDGASAVTSAVASVISSALAAARQAADSHSPARKFMPLGRDWDAGLAAGLEESALSSDAARRVVERVQASVLDFNAGFSERVAAASGATAHSTNNNGNTNLEINVTLHGDVGDMATARNYGREIAVSMEREARRRGVLMGT